MLQQFIDAHSLRILYLKLLVLFRIKFTFSFEILFLLPLSLVLAPPREIPSSLLTLIFLKQPAVFLKITVSFQKINMSHPQPPLSALNFRVKRPQHSWSQEERYLLCCLRRFFNLQWPQITKIFNEIHASKIHAEGFPLPQGLKKSTVTIQWVDLGRRFHDDWKYVHLDIPFEQGSSHFHYLFQKITTASTALHIGLVPRARDLDVSQFGLMATTRRRAQPAQPIPPVPPIQHLPATVRQATQAVTTEAQNAAASRPLENNPAQGNLPATQVSAIYIPSLVHRSSNKQIT